MELTVTSQADGSGIWTFELVGALDLASRDELTSAAGKALKSDDLSAIVLDLSGITFVDSTGIGAIVQIAGDASDVGAAFALRRPSSRVVRILQIAGLEDAWTVES